MKETSSKLNTALVIASIVAFIFLPKIVEWIFSPIVICTLILAYLIYEMLIDLIKKQYRTTTYIVTTEIMGIIVWIVLSYILFTMDCKGINFEELMVKQYHFSVVRIAFSVIVCIRVFLKGERFDKNKKVI